MGGSTFIRGVGNSFVTRHGLWAPLGSDGSPFGRAFFQQKGGWAHFHSDWIRFPRGGLQELPPPKRGFDRVFTSLFKGSPLFWGAPEGGNSAFGAERICVYKGGPLGALFERGFTSPFGGGPLFFFSAGGLGKAPPLYGGVTNPFCILGGGYLAKDTRSSSTAWRTAPV